MPKRRTEWKQHGGKWSKSIGERGTRVRLFQKRRDGVFYRATWIDGHRDVRSLATRNRDTAESLGRQFLVALLASPPEVTDRRPNSAALLGDLCDRFLKESPMLLDNTEHAQDEAGTRLRIVRAVIGDTRDVRTLSENDVRQYEARRRAGGIAYGEDSITRAVRQRSVQADVKLLKQVLNWACSVTHADGRRLLDHNPLQYVRVNGEHDVARPIASYDRFEATRKAMQGFQDRYAADAKTLESKRDRAQAARRCVTWIRAELALVLLEGTGKRRSSIVGLQWSDFDFAKRCVTWRPEHDKRRKTWVVPYPAAFFETIREFQRQLGAAGGFLFPRADDSTEHAPRELVSQWIRKAEIAAGLEKLPGGTCHPYRRKWRSERRHLPTKAVALAGGWSDVATMERCYDLPDEADLLAVTSETNKRREVLAVGNGARNGAR